MRFVYSLTVPADTPELASAQRKVRLVKGKLTRVLVEFLRGPHNQVFAVVRDGMMKIVPTGDSEALFGDGITHDVSMEYELADPAPELILEGWSPETRYPHQVTYSFDVVPEEQVVNFGSLANLLALPGRGAGG
jgi:hypothetical protein